MPMKPSENEEEYFARREVERRHKRQKETHSTLAEEEARAMRDLGKGKLGSVND